MKTIYFVDVKSNSPYTFETMAERGIGGTESTLLRVADRLTAQFQVYIVQACRENDDVRDSGISYLGMESAKQLAQKTPPDHVVLSRKIKMIQDMARWFPGAKLYLWIQDLPIPKYCRYRHHFIRYGATLICNSYWQKGEAERYLSPDCWYQRIFHPIDRRRSLDIRVLYNVINPAIKYQSVPIDRDKLVFFSAPRKGLKQVLEHFKEVIKVRPGTRLYIANPGYESMDPSWIDNPNLINLGSLSNAEVIQHVREAFCVFYPQNVLPETFGVIYAEANTVGTPVLCYDIGAASEILSDDSQILDVIDENVTQRLMDWYENGRPEVRGKPDYSLDRVHAGWLEMLGE